jgi:hypothetical protein
VLLVPGVLGMTKKIIQPLKQGIVFKKPAAEYVQMQKIRRDGFNSLVIQNLSLESLWRL